MSIPIITQVMIDGMLRSHYSRPDKMTIEHTGQSIHSRDDNIFDCLLWFALKEGVVA